MYLRCRSFLADKVNDDTAMKVSSHGLASFRPRREYMQKDAKNVGAEDSSDIRAVLWHWGNKVRFRCKEHHLSEDSDEESEERATMRKSVTRIADNEQDGSYSI